MNQFAGPAIPVFEMKAGAETIEEHEVIEPPLVLLAEIFETGPRVAGGGAQEVAGR